MENKHFSGDCKCGAYSHIDQSKPLRFILHGSFRGSSEKPCKMPQRPDSDAVLFMSQTKLEFVHINVVPRSTMNTNDEQRINSEV